VAAKNPFLLSLLLILIVLRKSVRLQILPLIFAVLIGSAIYLLHNYSVISNEIRGFVGKEVEVIGTVRSDLSSTKEKVIGSRKIPSRYTFLLRAELIRDGNSQLKTRTQVRVFYASPISIYPGTEIRLLGRIFPSKERGVSVNLTGVEGTAVIVESSQVLESLEKVRIGLRDQAKALGGDSASLLPGIIIGDTSLQSKKFTEEMRTAGLSHLTAVSGANFAIVGSFVYHLLGFIFPYRRLRIPMTLISLFIFILLVRPSPSVLRAALMAGIYFLSKFSGRKNSAEKALSAAISILLLFNPYLAFEAGFILSVLATAGLIYLADPIAQRIPGPKIIGELISIPIAATLACSPYLAFLAGSMNLGIIFMNIAVAPVIPIITILSFIATLAVTMYPSLSALLLTMANVGSKWIVFVASLQKVFPTIGISPIYLVILLIIVIYLLKASGSRLHNSKLLATLFLLFVILGSLQSFRFPGKNWVVGQCDVGQGDALLVRVDSHSAILFDAGPSSQLLERCLKEFGVTNLPLVVITHEHADHYEGVRSLKNIGEIWTNHQFNAELGIASKSVKAGYSASIGKVELDVIWPQDGDEEFESINGDGSLENNRSLVVLATVDDFRILITGDIEPAAQSEVLHSLSELDLDVIKVPHHGSKFQVMELFDSAELFLVSVGPNSYGHPNPLLMSQLTERGTVHRTDKSGPVAIGLSRKEVDRVFSLRTLRKDWWRLSWQ
jgi:competence protein ComEC